MANGLEIDTNISWQRLNASLIFQKNATACARRSFTPSPTNSLTLTAPCLYDGLHIWRIFRELKRIFW